MDRGRLKNRTCRTELLRGREEGKREGKERGKKSGSEGEGVDVACPDL